MYRFISDVHLSAVQTDILEFIRLFIQCYELLFIVLINTMADSI